MALLKKMAKAVTSAPKSILGGAVNSAAAIGSGVKSAVGSGVNILSGVLSGDTDKIKSNAVSGSREFGQNVKSFYGGVGEMAAGVGNIYTAGLADQLTGKALEGYNKTSSRSLGIDSSSLNSAQISKNNLAASDILARSKEAAIEAERPENERRAMFQSQYKNALLRGGNKKFNTLLGGGGY